MLPNTMKFSSLLTHAFTSTSPFLFFLKKMMPKKITHCNVSHIFQLKQRENLSMNLITSSSPEIMCPSLMIATYFPTHDLLLHSNSYYFAKGVLKSKMKRDVKADE